jgi:hypothetical protein
MMARCRSYLCFAIFLVFLPSVGYSQTTKKKASTPKRTPSVVRTNLNSRNQLVFGGAARSGPSLGLQGIVVRDGFDSIESPGYRRWNIVFFRSDGLPFPRDQQLEFTFGTFESPDAPAVRMTTELKQGASEHRDSFLVPEYFETSKGRVQAWAEFRCFADGRELMGLQSRTLLNFNNTGTSASPTNEITIVASKPILLGQFGSELSADEKSAIKQKNVFNLADRNLASPEWVPEEWRELMCRNTVVIDASSFEELTEEQQVALRGFVLGGGELILADFKDAKAVGEKLNDWFEACCSKSISKLVDEMKASKTFVAVGSETGFGRILLALEQVEYFYRHVDDRGAVAKWPTRSERLFDVDKMEWTIEKIGRPPVWLFLISITAYTLGAGPGLMWWLNRRLNRPIWLLAVFPLIAALITLSIFGFAIISDGFGIHGRLRSITTLNAKTGLACIYSRQTYFSGFPPEVARFDRSSEVFSIRSDHEGRNFRTWDATTATQPSIELTDESQDFRGLLSARVQKQWITTKPIEDFRPFEFSGEPIDGTWQIRNLLDESWLLGVFVDQEKRIWLTENVAKNRDAKLRLVDQATALSLIKPNLPVDRFPVGYFDTPDQSLFDWFSSNSSYNYAITQRRNRVANGMITESYESIPDDWLKKRLTEANQFFLLLERGNHVDRPFGDRVRESDSSHIVVGTW